MPGLTKEDRIKTVYGGGGHVVILGAGASIASTLRNPEPNGKILPSMNNFIEVVDLQDIVDTLPDKLISTNFEELYSRLYDDNPESAVIKEIEKRVHDYFSDMQLPPEATIYDYLVLALRPRDLIATFNWDPLLYQAFVRNRKIADLPYFAYLHGNVALGYSKLDMNAGPAGWYSKATGDFFEPSKLLFPIKQKDYGQDDHLKQEWDRIKYWLGSESTKVITVFGFSAPDSDREALKILENAWKGYTDRDIEKFEIIDRMPQEEILKRWESFLNSSFYDYNRSYFDSSLAINPRRTSEGYFQLTQPLTPVEAFSESNPVPKDIHSLDELWEWHRPLIEAEEEWKKQNPE